MGTTKSEIFTAAQNELSMLFKVLAHPARIAILEYISKQKSCICNDIVAEIGLAQPTISQHLKELKKLNLIQGQIEGKKQCYCINTQQWEAVKKQIIQYFNTTKANCC